MERSLQKTLEQQRAQKAWEDVRSVLEQNEAFRKKYGSLARKVPMLVLTSGLGQTLAFLRAKSKNNPADEHSVLFQHLSEWTMNQIAPNARDKDLLTWILENDSASYRRATIEALAYLVWLKRFAEAELPTEEG